jgi:hypothetical protein
MDIRRRTPRQAAGWTGTCLIEEDPDGRWRDCWVLDISMLGLGIALDHRRPAELIGRSISVEFPAVGDLVSVRLEGKIKNIDVMRLGLVHAGVEFVGLSQEELAIATVLGALTEIDEPSPAYSGAPSLHLVEP